jgi:2-aminoethylphosphonate-pyruvate transaminase
MRVKEAMLRDLGSRDTEFISAVKEIRAELLALGNVTPANFTCVPVQVCHFFNWRSGLIPVRAQGSGTFAVESAITSSVPREHAKLLVIHNGAYGQRVVKIAQVLGIPVEELEFPEQELPALDVIERKLQSTPGITNVAMVHCETSSGMFNPVEAVGRLVKQHHPAALYFVDAMSSFGAVPLDLERGQIDFVVSSANKCVQGVPGFSYVLARRSVLAACAGRSRSLSLDLVEQNKGLDASGQFRFTPATHSMLAFREALRELAEEGGPAGRAARYRENRRIVQEGMGAMGFKVRVAAVLRAAGPVLLTTSTAACRVGVSGPGRVGVHHHVVPVPARPQV